MSLNDYFKAHHHKRAISRRHRPCKIHGHIQHVCASCSQVYCPQCATHPCIPKKASKAPPIRLSTYTAPPALKPIWALVRPMGALYIEPHEDADAWKVLFPPHALGVSTASELADRFWSQQAVQDLATATVFRAGRGNKPPHWWVSFHLKEQA